MLCAARWALHPMQVSTVLYVVQRMTELAALFSLLGLICYVYGRQFVARPIAAWTWMASGIGFFGLLAALSKESRSEEHTSELQSLMRISYAVFCLKKKKKEYTINHIRCQC